MLLLTSWLILLKLSEVWGQCKDGQYCSELLNVRFTFASRTTKCAFWVYGLAPDLFPKEAIVPVASRLLTSAYCPVACSTPCNPTTKIATTVQIPLTVASTEVKTMPVANKTTTTAYPTTTTINVTQQVDEIVNKDATFGDLLKNFDGDLSPEEALIRFQLYTEKKEAVDKHNQMFAAGLVSYTMAVNKFSILKPDEIAPNVLSTPPLSSAHVKTPLRKKRAVVQKSKDWRSNMSPVLDQKKCGGCWAFAMTAMLEGTLSIRDLGSTSLSVQQLLDCDRAVNPTYDVANQGCSGGYLNVATDYLSKKSLKAANLYPFTGTSSTICRLPIEGQVLLSSFQAEFRATDDSDELEILNQDMEERVLLGPVAVGFANSDQVYAYGMGVFDGPCGKSINHAVVIVGFTKDYWIVRNSWGPAWGEKGHIRIRREAGKDPCKMVQYWSTAAPLFRPPTQNNAANGESEEDTDNTVVFEQNTTVTAEPLNDRCDGEDCDHCDCDDDDEEWGQDGTIYVWTSTPGIEIL